MCVMQQFLSDLTLVFGFVFNPQLSTFYAT